MDDVDVGLFDRDWNNTLYFFLLNADEQIYMRYGGRDSASPDAYLDLSSLELALQQGVELHRQYLSGERKNRGTPEGDFPARDPAAGGAHLQATPVRRVPSDWELSEPSAGAGGTLEKLTHLYRSPDIKTLGITLDVPKGLVVKEAGGAVQVAGMKPGDRITGLNGTLVWTFGDLQYVYDKVDRKATRIQIAVDRNGEPAVLEITLPPRWWWTDLRFRQSSVEARTLLRGSCFDR